MTENSQVRTVVEEFDEETLRKRIAHGLNCRSNCLAIIFPVSDQLLFVNLPSVKQEFLDEVNKIISSYPLDKAIYKGRRARVKCDKWRIMRGMFDVISIIITKYSADVFSISFMNNDEKIIFSGISFEDAVNFIADNWYNSEKTREIPDKEFIERFCPWVLEIDLRT